MTLVIHRFRGGEQLFCGFSQYSGEALAFAGRGFSATADNGAQVGFGNPRHERNRPLRFSGAEDG